MAALDRRAFGAMLGAALALPATRAEARQFRAADNQVAEYPTVQALEYFGRLLRERSAGRHQLTVFHSRQLGEEGETLLQTRAGALDVNRVNVAPLAEIVPQLNALLLPFMFDSPRHLNRVLDGEVGRELLGKLTPYGLVGLAFYDSGTRSIYNSQRPVRTLADLRGLRIRVQQSQITIEMIRRLGATPVPLPYGQVGTALTTRIIDGAENNWPSYVTTGHARVARHITLTEHTAQPEVLVMSMRAWDGLSAEDQGLVREAARESALFMRDLWRTWEEQAQQDAIASGVLVVADADRDSFRGATAPMSAEMRAANPELDALVRRIEAAR
jgi:tripartite ATP-independent transporter DctP family solute receptor